MYGVTDNRWWPVPLVLIALALVVGRLANDASWVDGAGRRAAVGEVQPAPATTEWKAAEPEIAIEIPASIREEHREVRDNLAEAMRVPGKVGEAARGLWTVLRPHFAREEEIALRPLGVLRPLVEHRMTTDMLGVLPMTDSLEIELPRMLEEHKAIRAAVERLATVAKQEGKLQQVELAERLKQHALTEEEVLYPAAVLAGQYLKLQLILRPGIDPRAEPKRPAQSLLCVGSSCLCASSS